MNIKFETPQWDQFEATIGYRFTNRKLLYHAMTHSSYANEKKLDKSMNNERLEFLGDSVLELSSSDYLYNNKRDMMEGSLTRLRASLVCEVSLAASARSIGLPDYILLGRGEEATGGRLRDSVISDAFEALIGAIYLDGGYERADSFIRAFVLNDIDNKVLFIDSKTILQEFSQSAGFLPEYKLIEESGPDHCKSFTVNVTINNVVMGEGCGHNKKAAEQQAAYAAIIKIKEQNICS